MEYEESGAGRALPWDQARPAAQAAWERIVHTEREIIGEIIGFTLLDAGNDEVGQVHTAWLDEQERPVFAGLTTTWILGKVHLLPLRDAQIQAAERLIRLPYPRDLIKAGPTIVPEDTLSPEDQQRAFLHFHTPEVTHARSV